MALLVALLVWPLAAFGGTHASTAIPFGLICLTLAVLTRPAIGGALNRALLILLGVMAGQAIPLPLSIVTLLSPHAGRVRAQLALDGSGTAGRTFVPLSIDVPASVWALAVMAGAVAIFFLARRQFSVGGVRQTVRLVAAAGFAVSLLAIAQAVTAGRRIYWLFPTEFEGALPFGPFVNRNHFAAWAIMAIPLTAGYVAARAGTKAEPPAHVAMPARLVRAIDARTAWLITALVTMVAALLLSLSRSGAVALALSSAVTVVLARRRLTIVRRRGVLAAIAVAVLLGIAWSDVPALRDRFLGTRTGISNRVTIWRETAPLVRDFWLTGSGAGTYQRAMLVYQRSDRTFMFNQAHNHYLQVVAEGGMLLACAAALALVAYLRDARWRVSHDTSGMTWIRTGAACGLLAVALQSAWETGLVMPANAALAAVLAALVVHSREAPTEGGPLAPRR